MGTKQFPDLGAKQKRERKSVAESARKQAAKSMRSAFKKEEPEEVITPPSSQQASPSSTEALNRQHEERMKRREAQKLEVKPVTHTKVDDEPTLGKKIAGGMKRNRAARRGE